jgi:hypothetical protein
MAKSSQVMNKSHYALNEMEREIIQVVRTLTWLELDDLTDSISTSMPNA